MLTPAGMFGIVFIFMRLYSLKVQGQCVFITWQVSAVVLFSMKLLAFKNTKQILYTSL